MNKSEDLELEISRLLAHLKIRPTFVVLNTIYIALKNYGYKEIPRIQLSEHESNILDQKIIMNYCIEINKMMEFEPESEERKKNSLKEVYMFQESSMLPQNVYVSEKGDEDKIEDNYTEDEITDTSESENSINSEQEQEEEGYFYEENDSDQFSE